MHIPSISLITSYIYNLGGPSTSVHVVPTGFGLGEDDYGTICDNKLFDKPIIYKTAEHFCKTNATQPTLRNRKFEETGYRTDFPPGTTGDNENLLNSNHDIVPIRKNVVFPYELGTKERLKKYKEGDKERSPDYHRLLIGPNCVVLGAFFDVSHFHQREPLEIRWCKIHQRTESSGVKRKKSPDYFSSTSRSYKSHIRPSERNSEFFRRISPETSIERDFRPSFRFVQRPRERPRERPITPPIRPTERPLQETREVSPDSPPFESPDSSPDRSFKSVMNT